MKTIQEGNYISFGQAVKNYFIGFFDFKGATSRRGFWFGLIPALVLNGVLLLAIEWLPAMLLNYQLSSFMLSSLLQGTEQFMNEFFYIIALFLILVAVYLFLQIGLFALMSRRLRHIGFKPLGIMCWLVFFAVIQSLSYNHNALGFFIFLLQLVTFVVQVILLSLPKHALTVSSDSLLSHFVATIPQETVKKKTPTPSVKKDLSDVDRMQLMIEKKYIQK